MIIHIIVNDLIACYVLWYVHLTFPFHLIFIPYFVIHTITFLLVLSYINPPALCPLPFSTSTQWCCAVCQKIKAGVLYNEFCIHVNEMVKSTKRSVFKTVFINNQELCPWNKGGNEWLQLWMNNILWESWICCSCEQCLVYLTCMLVPGSSDLSPYEQFVGAMLKKKTSKWEHEWSFKIRNFLLLYNLKTTLCIFCNTVSCHDKHWNSMLNNCLYFNINQLGKTGLFLHCMVVP